MTTLARMNPGENAMISHILENRLTNKFLEMGLLPGVMVALTICAPLGGPVCVRVSGSYDLTLRRSEAAMILVQDINHSIDEKITNSSSGEA